MRLIDAEALGAEFNSRMLDGIHSFAARNVIKFIEAQQTVDAVPVVRCADCTYGQNFPNGLCYRNYEVHNGKGEGVICVEPNDYCSYGKRKDGAE